MLLICFILISLLSEVFLLSNANHEHDHHGADGGCATCAHILSAEHQLRQITAAVIRTAYAIVALFTAVARLSIISTLFGYYTLIDLKTRMDH